MRKRVLLLALVSVLMSLCVPLCAQQVLPKGSTKEEVMRKFPGLVIDDEGNATINGEPVSIISLDYSVKVQPSEPSKPDTGIHILDSRTNDDNTVALTQLTADMIAKVQKYTMSHEEYFKLVEKSIEFEYVIEIGKISKKTRARREDKENYTKKIYKVPEGITFKELITSLPGIEIDKAGRFITKERKSSVSHIGFNNQIVLFNDSYDPYYTNDIKLATDPIRSISDSSRNSSRPTYTDDTKLGTGTVYVQIKQQIYHEELTDESDIIIEYYPDVSPDLVGGNSQYVDLGLSVKWASRNVDASGPDEMGGLYSWSEDDVVHDKWGGSWRMPTTDQIDELIHNCTWSWASMNGQIGFLVTSNKPGYTDRSIFLPYAFFGTSGELSYWSCSTDPDNLDRAACLWIHVYDDNVRSGSCFRHLPWPVRPVCP